MKRALAIVVVLCARLAHADDNSDEPTAADVETAPLPGEESGRTDQPEGDSVLRDIGQGVLTVPKVAVEVALAPVRTGIWAFDRYDVEDRFYELFFDKTITYGIYPTVTYDSTYGVNGGGRALHRNMFGEHERLSLLATTGGQFRTLVDGQLGSGLRFGPHVALELRAELEQRPRDPWYGIGNASRDIRTRYREELKRVSGYLDVTPFPHLVLRTTGSLTDRTYASSTEGVPIEAVHDTSMLTGFSGVENIYGELEVRWDRRARVSTPGRHQIYDTGYMLSAFGGRVHQIHMQTGEDHWRYGAEAQHFLGLGVGPRALMTRVHVESVTGELSDVVFNQLPALGGSVLLRGYAPDRFRDRAAVVGTAEYIWGLGQLFLASLFVDAGRVYPSLADVSTDDLRVGFGATLQLHGNRQFISGVTVASSVDGGVFVNLSFDPVFDYDPRGERR